MKSKKPGLLSEFHRIASSDLSKNTIATYTCWLKAFHRFTGRGAATWAGRDITDFIHHMEREGYSLRSRQQALCAIVFIFKRVLNIDPGNLNLPKIQRPKPSLTILPTREELARIFAGLRVGHESLETTAIYVHADEAPGTSPLDVSLPARACLFSILSQPLLNR